MNHLEIIDSERPLNVRVVFAVVLQKRVEVECGVERFRVLARRQNSFIALQRSRQIAFEPMDSG